MEHNQSKQKFKPFTLRHLDAIPGLADLPKEDRFAVKVVGSVLPFRVNSYVAEQLIDWDDLPNDPIYQLVFPQPGMLKPGDFSDMAELIRRDAPKAEVEALAWKIRARLNPHPAGQLEHNVPRLDGRRVNGLQHKYRETVLCFPARAQTCHAYCSFCFRWPQFVGDADLRQANMQASEVHRYLAEHEEVTDLLMTGGDPMVMQARHLEEYLKPLLDGGLEHIRTLRFGSKALTYWPYRFTTDADADDLLRLFERLVAQGRSVSFMAHFNHWREMTPPAVAEAIGRIRNTGATIRCQGPLLKHINDDPAVWSRMWREQVGLGMVPYYMFVARDTGARHYFEVPLGRAWEIFRDAASSVSGIARTVRGPSMSATPGKIEVQGVTDIAGEKVFALRMLQGRDPDWTYRPFFAKFDEKAAWLDDLKPAFGERRFFFEKAGRDIRAA